MRLIRLPALLLLCQLFLARSGDLQAQTIPVGDLREEQLKLQQLLNDSLSTSYTNRPVWTNVYNRYMDAAAGKAGWWNRKIEVREENLDDTFRAGIYEPFMQSTFNSALPVGENNAAAWYGRGMTTDFQGGFYLTSDYLTISVRPQFVYQQNSEFEAPRFVPRDSKGNAKFLAEGISHRIDAPYRFGPDPYWTIDPGHSSIRIHYRNIEAGASTEPLWWGGAERYPLMLSNNAAGIPHLFIGTRGPLRIPWFGSIEFKWMAGTPRDSEWYSAPEDYQHERFVNSANVTWTPAFIPNLHLGLTRSYLIQNKNGIDLRDFTVLFDPFQKAAENENEALRDQAASIYIRWVFPKAHAEIFGEFYREDHSFDFRDFLMQPHHNSAYSFGFQKIFFTPASIFDFVKLHVELTDLSPSRLDEIRWQTYFYTHSEIRQGQTNNGEVWGAAIGPGSNSLYLGLDGYHGDFKFGVFIQRYLENDHFHYRWQLDHVDRPWGQKDKWHHRVNLNAGGNILWGPGPLYVQGKFIWTKAYNYGRNEYGNIQGLDWDSRVLDDIYNLQFQLGVRYVF